MQPVGETLSASYPTKQRQPEAPRLGGSRLSSVFGSPQRTLQQQQRRTDNAFTEVVSVLGDWPF